MNQPRCPARNFNHRALVLKLAPTFPLAAMCWGVWVLLAVAHACAQETSLSNLLRRHEYDNALRQSDTLLRQNANNAPTWMYRGLANNGLERKQDAISDLKHALQLDPSLLQAAEAGAQIAYREKDASEDYFLNQVVRLDAGNQTAHAMMGVLALEQQHCSDALAHFSQAGGLEHQDVDVGRKLARCSAEAGDIEGSLKRLHALQAAAPEDRRLLLDLAGIEMTAHRYHEAIALLEPESERLDTAGLNLLAAAYTAVDNVAVAVTTYRAAIQRAPSDERNYLDLAILSMDHQSPEVALGVLDAGIRNNPQAARLLVLRGTVYAQTGKEQLAQADFQHADQLEPASTYGTLALGVLLREESNLDEAEKVVEHKLVQKPNDALLNFMLADTLVRKGVDPGDAGFLRAERLLESAIASQPDLAQAHALLGKLELKEGRTTDAVAQLELAVQLQSTDRTALNQLLTGYRRLSRTADADRVATILAKSVAEDRARETERNRIHLTLSTADQPALTAPAAASGTAHP